MNRAISPFFSRCFGVAILSVASTMTVWAQSQTLQEEVSAMTIETGRTQQNSTLFAIFVLILIVILVAVSIFAWIKRTEAEDYKDQLMTLNDELDRQHAALEVQKDFAHQASHQMRTPINAIVGFADLLHEDTGLSREESDEYTDILVDNAHRLVRVMDDFMAYTALERELYTLQLRQESVLSMVDEAVTRVVSIIKPDVSLVLHTMMQEEYTVLIDRQRFVQLFTKLLQYVGVLTISGEIKVEAIISPTGNTAKYKVHAPSVQCTDEEKRHMFDRYFRISGDRETSGLELPICTLLADMLCGRVAVDTSVEEGLCLTFTHALTPCYSIDPVTELVKTPRTKKIL